VSETAIIKLYRLSPRFKDTELVRHLLDDCKYSEFPFDSRIQNNRGIVVSAFKKTNRSIPDWYSLLKPYQPTGSRDLDFISWDMVAFISHVSKANVEYHYLLTGGSGYHDVSKHLDHGFGLELLERVFDPETNKIDTVADRGIIGNVLASIRFYRKGRHLSGEEDFGKYFQKVHVRLLESQVEFHFPILKAKNRKNHNQVIISGSSCLEIRRKETLSVFLDLIPSISSLLETPPVPVFNRTLSVLTRNRDSDLIRTLNDDVYREIADAIVADEEIKFDFDFCHRDFEEFFASTKLIVSFQMLNLEFPAKKEANEHVVEDFSRLSDQSLFDELGTLIKNSREYKSANNKNEFVGMFLHGARIRTTDDSGKTTTEGPVIEYLQAERRLNGKAYFLLDTNWFLLLPEFDDSLTEKFKKKIAKKVKLYDFLPQWLESESEDQYNEKFLALPNSFFLHKVLSSNIEMCDFLYHDITSKKLFILHAKDGVGAQMRDLTSQVFLSARIIEEEIRTGSMSNIDHLYKLGMKKHRIDSSKLSLDNFRDLFRENQREYGLVVKGRKGLDQNRFVLGNFDSRIAKFSLYEFSGVMAINEWQFSVAIL